MQGLLQLLEVDVFHPRDTLSVRQLAEGQCQLEFIGNFVARLLVIEKGRQLSGVGGNDSDKGHGLELGLSDAPRRTLQGLSHQAERREPKPGVGAREVDDNVHFQQSAMHRVFHAA